MRQLCRPCEKGSCGAADVSSSRKLNISYQILKTCLLWFCLTLYSQHMHQTQKKKKEYSTSRTKFAYVLSWPLPGKARREQARNGKERIRVMPPWLERHLYVRSPLMFNVSKSPDVRNPEMENTTLCSGGRSALLLGKIMQSRL